jgi:hypothetical protein
VVNAGGVGLLHDTRIIAEIINTTEIGGSVIEVFISQPIV